MYDADSLIIVSILGVIVLITFGIARQFSVKLHIISLLLFGSVMLILSDTLFPIVLYQNYRQLLFGEVYWLVPFDYSRTLISADNPGVVITNVLNFIPIGILVPVLVKGFNTFSRVVGLGVLSYGLIEGLRWLISFVAGFRYTAFIIDELFLFTAGVVLGFLVLKLFVPFIGSFIDVQHLNRKKHKEA